MNIPVMNKLLAPPADYIATLVCVLVLSILPLFSGCGVKQAGAEQKSSYNADNNLINEKIDKKNIASPIPPVASLTDGLLKRLNLNPDDPDGWALLARSYYFLGETLKAEAAKEEAINRGYKYRIAKPAASTKSQAPKQLPANHPPVSNNHLSKPFLDSLDMLMQEHP